MNFRTKKLCRVSKANYYILSKLKPCVHVFKSRDPVSLLYSTILRPPPLPPAPKKVNLRHKISHYINRATREQDLHCSQFLGNFQSVYLKATTKSHIFVKFKMFKQLLEIGNLLEEKPILTCSE